MTTVRKSEFANAFEHMQTKAYENSKAHGFHEEHTSVHVVVAKNGEVIGSYTDPKRADLACPDDGRVVDCPLTGVVKNFGEQVALMHSELSEALEAFRYGNPPSDHIPEFSGVEEELADVVIRAMDCAQLRGYRLAEAIEAKHAFNVDRPFKHGGKKF